MTAPRMTDEQFALHVRGEARQKGDLLRETKRARSAESAALARVRRLEEALGQSLDAWKREANSGDGMTDEDFALFSRAHAALSEET